MKNISILKIIMSLSEIMDLISDSVVSHHKKVTYIAYKIGEEMGVDNEELENIVMASLVHDIGVFYLNNIDLHDFSLDDEDNIHSLIGYYLINESDFLSRVSTFIKYHHKDWNEYKETIPLESNILHLADEIAFLTDIYDIYSESDVIGNTIMINSGFRYWPEAVESFQSLMGREYFGLAVKSFSVANKMTNNIALPKRKISVDMILDITKVISFIIDFRSPFTATHSMGVAAVAVELAKLLGFTSEEQSLMEIAGHLHDIGKLIVQRGILNKQGKLDSEEWRVMRSHPYYTYEVLDTIDELPYLKEWSAYHHETLDGEGYPFHLGAEELSSGARIMAVADIFTAVREDRPYRAGMEKDEVIEILQDLVRNNKIDGDIVSILLDNYLDIDKKRMENQEQAEDYCQRFRTKIDSILI